MGRATDIQKSALHINREGYGEREKFSRYEVTCLLSSFAKVIRHETELDVIEDLKEQPAGGSSRIYPRINRKPF